jgi:hypothetical protein
MCNVSILNSENVFSLQRHSCSTVQFRSPSLSIWRWTQPKTQLHSCHLVDYKILTSRKTYTIHYKHLLYISCGCRAMPPCHYYLTTTCEWQYLNKSNSWSTSANGQLTTHCVKCSFLPEITQKEYQYSKTLKLIVPSKTQRHALQSWKKYRWINKTNNSDCRLPSPEIKSYNYQSWEN